MKIKWLPRDSHQTQAISELEDALKDSPPLHRRLTISLLTFGTFTHCAELLADICDKLQKNKYMGHLKISIIVRNNNPRLDSAQFDQQWQNIIDDYQNFEFMLFNDGMNVGYGQGHNLNFDALFCDYFLILNDDMAFRGVEWLETALAILENNEVVAGVGAANSPSSITPFYANGVYDRQWHRWPLRYIEGSAALLRATAFTKIGKFDPAYEWALCEDSDLSFRFQAMGFRLEWIDIPHEHSRGSSLSCLPGQVKASILEHNRSVFFSKWNASISQNRVGRFQIFDLWSDGLGDVFISSLHLKGYLYSLTDEQKATVVVNTSAPDIVRLILGDEIIIQSVPDRQQLVSDYSEFGVRSLNSLRELNYGLPFNLHALLCGALGIPVATREILSSAIGQRSRKSNGKPTPDLPREPYCVVHLESDRVNHDGRVPSRTTTSLIAALAAEVFPNLVVVGRTKHVALDSIPSRCGVVDLRGRLSISALIDVISSADSFVGLDSFPAHIAQVAGVKSVVFFGSIHPLFRVLSTGQTWPIVKNVDCIGCYHTLIEPAIPYCMPRDLSCTKDIPRSEILNVMENCASSEAFDWRQLELRALELQQKFLTKMFFHPDPQKRFFNVAGTPQLATTSLIEQVIEQVREHLVSSGTHHSIASTILEIDEAKQEIHRKDVQIESMVKLIADLRAENGRQRWRRKRPADKD